MMTREESASSVAMFSKGGNKEQHHASLKLMDHEKPGSLGKDKREAGGCTYCRNLKHTRDTCFKLHGFPDWWHELKTKKKREGDCAAIANSKTTLFAHPQLSLMSQEETSPAVANFSTSHNNLGTN